MIKLEVGEHCQNCPSFEANVSKKHTIPYEDKEQGMLVVGTETIIRCMYANYCPNYSQEQGE